MTDKYTIELEKRNLDKTRTLIELQKDYLERIGSIAVGGEILEIDKIEIVDDEVLYVYTKAKIRDVCGTHTLVFD